MTKVEATSYCAGEFAARTSRPVVSQWKGSDTMMLEIVHSVGIKLD